MEEKKITAIGKFQIELRVDGYHFYLLANNGQLLFDCPGFVNEEGAVKGIETFRAAVESDKFIIYEDKFNRFRYILNKRYVGENYNTRRACESSVESVKRFTATAKIVPSETDPEAEKAFKETRAAAKAVKDVDWNLLFAQPIKRYSGKYEITKEDDGYHFYLLANNGQLLFSSRGYASFKGVEDGIVAFKKAVYLANFYVDADKFGRFRFILRSGSAAVVYLGESYNTYQAAESSAESVKRFAWTASTVTCGIY